MDVPDLPFCGVEAFMGYYSPTEFFSKGVGKMDSIPLDHNVVVDRWALQ